MNAAVQKLLSLGASLSIGLGAGWFEIRARSLESRRSPVSMTPGNAEPAIPDILPESLPLIFQGLSSADSEEKKATKATLEFLPDEEFDDPSAAANWWQQNRYRFDRNLIRAE